MVLVESDIYSKFVVLLLLLLLKSLLLVLVEIHRGRLRRMRLSGLGCRQLSFRFFAFHHKSRIISCVVCYLFLLSLQCVRFRANNTRTVIYTQHRRQWKMGWFQNQVCFSLDWCSNRLDLSVVISYNQFICWILFLVEIYDMRLGIPMLLLDPAGHQRVDVDAPRVRRLPLRRHVRVRRHDVALHARRHNISRKFPSNYS